MNSRYTTASFHPSHFSLESLDAKLQTMDHLIQSFQQSMNEIFNSDCSVRTMIASDNIQLDEYGTHTIELGMNGVNKEDIKVKLNSSLQNITVYGKRHGTIGNHSIVDSRDSFYVETLESPQPTVLYMWYGNLNRPVDSNNVQVKFIENLGVVIELKVQAPTNDDSQDFRSHQDPDLRFSRNAYS